MKFLIRNILREQTQNYKIVSAKSKKPIDIFNFLSSNFPQVPVQVLMEELFDVDYNLSLLALSDTKIIGTLLFSKESICDYLETTKILRIDKTPELETLCNSNGIKGVVYAIDPQFRGTSLNVDFIRLAKELIKNHDFTYALVYSFLRTHNFWKRIGFKNYATVIDDDNVVEVYLLK